MTVARETPQVYTAEDLTSPEVPEKFVELVEGELIHLTPADWRHNRVASRMERLFEAYCLLHDHLEYAGDNDGFVIKRGPDSVLSPDAALFRKPAYSTRPWRDFSPEIVVEVLSPSTTTWQLTSKRQRYFKAGTQQFWLVDIEKRQIQFHCPDGRIVTVSGEETYEADGFAAGLIINLRELFRGV